MTRQLNAGLEEVKMLFRNHLSDQVCALQSQMNELVEQSRHPETSELQEVVRSFRDSQIELKQDVKAQSQLMTRKLRDHESKFKEGLTAQLQEFVHALENSACEMKEHVSKVQANLSSKLTVQQRSWQRALDSFKQNNESTAMETPLGAASLGTEKDIPQNMQEWFPPFKLERFVVESLNTLEFLRQQIYKHENEPRASKIAELNPTCVPRGAEFLETQF